MSKAICKQETRRACATAAARPVANEEGFVLITVMLVMLLLLGLVLAAAEGTVIETLIARNNQEYTVNFHKADGAAQELAQQMENTLDREELQPNAGEDGKWIFSDDHVSNNEGVASAFDKRQAWNDPENKLRIRQSTTLTTDNTDDVQQLAVYKGVARGDKGGSLNMASAQMRQYEIYGRARKKNAGDGNGGAVVAIGFKKRI
ncbi:MAG: hypothetical protein LBU39_00645 [Desulfobulbaceae bacterium]|jgi:Tfp pilus assembly protein PilX|nr:hypothetical protein [Desulfobulbaceae bacterium]